MSGRYQPVQLPHVTKADVVSYAGTFLSAFLGASLAILVFGYTMTPSGGKDVLPTISLPSPPSLESPLLITNTNVETWDHATKNESTSESLIRLLNYVTRRTHLCDSVLIGNGGFGEADRPDGAWPVCPIESLLQRRNNCVVYSFGINNDFSFDDEIARKYGCQVHSFDPTMNKASHKRSDKVSFWDIGLGSTIGRNPSGWNVSTVSGIMNMLKHDRVDVFKMDIEGSEWPSLLQMIESGALWKIDQLSLEIHSDFSGKGTSYEANLIRDVIHNFNFKIFAWHVNPYSNKLNFTDSGLLQFTQFYEISMVRV
ncbi:hypothetical protein SeMB42_g02896 [Synchytrium endobioticum]|uniref:Methyltransferase domain-containing protein n=1 Tax=Synchytrium endobioticum TaxID=286115 RepID=A0A507DB88_9FUNG|nr:hypothetical protein SeMB42_g02896 [Synchytrium endobioticum]